MGCRGVWRDRARPREVLGGLGGLTGPEGRLGSLGRLGGPRPSLRGLGLEGAREGSRIEESMSYKPYVRRCASEGKLESEELIEASSAAAT